MIVDITGTILIPGNQGENCPGNGEYTDEYGNYIECCCEECDYMICCFKMKNQEMCNSCHDYRCPNSKKP